MSISVIIPFKKNIDFLRETIDCFLNQSLLPSEIIIVNDHSEESLTPLKKAYNDQITFLENPGAGACDARNYGFLASKGNFIKFFDSDDLTTNNTLEVQSKALENSDRKMIYGPVVKVFSSNGKWQQQDTIIYYNKYKSKIPFDKLLLHGWSCGLPQCMFKREIFNEAGLWESGLQSRQDVEFLFRIAQIEPYPLHENLSCLFYRQHEMQITGGAITNEHLSQDLVYVLEKIRESVLSDPLRYNLIDRFNIESQLAIHLKSCSKSFQKDFTKSHNSVSILTSFLGPKIFRFNNKYQRLLTHSNWNIDIGPKKDPEVFLEFQTKIKLPSATFKAIESLKVSIIIPTLNRKHLIEKTLNNILNQTIKPYEIIVVDDHSIDGTFDYLKANYKDHVIIIENEGNGPGAARNTGLRIATSNYIKFFDSDDLMTSNTLEVQTSALNNSQKGLIYSPFFYASQNSDGVWHQTDPAILNYFPFPQNKNLLQWMCRGLFLPIPGMLFKKEFLKDVGYWRVDIITSEDWQYLWRIGMIEPFPLHSKDNAFLYRIHGNQSTLENSNNLKRDIEKLNVLKEIESVFWSRNLLNKTDKLYFKNKYYQTFRFGAPELTQFSSENQDNSIKNKLFGTYNRINQKFGRVITRSNWQTMHGPVCSGQVLENYLSMIN